jgi:NAD-dependent DNA ligase
MTGFRDKDTISNLENVGAIQSITITKSTFVLIVKDNENKNIKVKTAEELGVPIMTLVTFKEKYKI